MRHLAALLVVLAAMVNWSCQSSTAAPAPPKVEAPAPVVPKEPEFREISMRAMNRRIPVIMYHDVKAKSKKVWFDSTAAEFEADMKFLADQGAVPISLDDLYAHLTEGKEVPETAVVLTFDDNYQGFYDNALPILEKYQFPAAMFVHTGFVGETEGDFPKMTWDTLRELVKNPLITIGGHTVNHLELDGQTEATQRDELKRGKEDLEKELGITVRYLAYPVGKFNETTLKVTKEEGYLMAFTIENQLAQESPGILQIGRYIQTRLRQAWDEREAALEGAPATVSVTPLADSPVSYTEQTVDGVRLGLIQGGRALSLNSATRKGVREFVQEVSGVGGVNGGFFDMASIAGKDNKMIGPFKSSDLPILIPDQFPARWPKLRNRPVVIWGPTQFAILPFAPEVMNNEKAFKEFMPDFTDVFLAGVWLVRDGEAQTRSEQNRYGAKDIQDSRKRAFVGVTADGRPVLGATLNNAPSHRLAKAIAEAGVWQAVLLDSGFSTSLVFGEEIKAFGHSTKDRPSRPVPHAIVVKGTVEAPVENP